MEDIDSTWQYPKYSSKSLGVSYRSIRRMLKFHPYKIKLVHAFNGDDYDTRLEFGEEISQRLVNNPNLLFNICFTDECMF